MISFKNDDLDYLPTHLCYLAPIYFIYTEILPFRIHFNQSCRIFGFCFAIKFIFAKNLIKK